MYDGTENVELVLLEIKFLKFAFISIWILFAMRFLGLTLKVEKGQVFWLFCCKFGSKYVLKVNTDGK